MVRTVFYSFILVMWLLVWLLPISLAHYLHKKPWRNAMLQRVNRGILRILNVQVILVGELPIERPVFLVSNHISYLDVPIIASVIDARFTPKSEIASWPFIGYCCRLFDSVFITRDAKNIEHGKQALSKALNEGAVVLLFPEATTGDGVHMLPFKPAFFDVAVVEGNNIPVIIQPLAIRYMKISGLPIDKGQWPNVAWYGDMALLPHFINLISLGKIEVELHVLPIIIPQAGQDRKQLAKATETAIEQALTNR